MKLTLVSGEEDWEGLYIDDDLVTENHTISSHQIILELMNYREGKLNVELEDVQMITVSAPWMEKQGHLPNSLKKIPKKAIVFIE